MKESRIPFNVWDDFWDDGYVPDGEIQSTHGYIENDMTGEQKCPIVRMIYYHILTLDMTGLVVRYSGDRIDFDNLTHKRLDKLMDELRASNLKYGGIPIDFYSES